MTCRTLLQHLAACGLILAAGTASAGQPVPLMDRLATDQLPSISVIRDPIAVVSRYGNIVDKRDVGVGGLTAWTVERNGHQIVLYTTADVSVLFTGVMWDAATGKNLSDQFLPHNNPALNASSASKVPSAPARVSAGPAQLPSPAAMQGATTVEPSPAAAMDGSYSGPIPESMKTVDSLAGVKEGSGGIADTVYVIIDPRCPYCRAAYNGTREHVAKGRTIKWLPASVLANPEEGIPLAATLLQSSDPTVLGRVLGNHEAVSSTPTPATLAALRNNAAFLHAAFQANAGEGSAGVPVAFFLDHRTGTPRMMKGLSDQAVINDIFGKL